MTLNLTSDLVSRNCCISPIFFEIRIWYVNASWDAWVSQTIFWVTLTSDLVFKNDCVQSISAILFDVGIPNLGCWFLLGWRSGAYHFESLWLWHLLLASFMFFALYYSYLSSNVSYARPIPLGAFVTCLWHFLFTYRNSNYCSFSWNPRYKMVSHHCYNIRKIFMNVALRSAS